MFFQRRTIPGLAIHTYVVGDEQSKTCAVVDPARDVEAYIEIAEREGMTIAVILETHVHADFVSGANELKQRLGGRPLIYCSGMGGKEWIPKYADKIVSDGEEVQLGHLTFKAVHTPGHTPEHVMWVLSENGAVAKLFTGDFLFVGDVGRPDLLGEKEQERLAHQLYNSVFSRLDPYNDNTEVRPAHGAGSLCGKALGSHPYSVLGVERRSNPALRKRSEKEWVADLMRDMPPVPQYFPRMKKINVTGAPMVGGQLPGRMPLSVKDFKEKIDSGAVVVDTRSKEAFAGAHIAGSINIPLGPQLATWAGWLLPNAVPLIFILDNPEDFDEAATQLLRIGFDRLEGYLEGGLWAWESQALPLRKLQTMTSRQLHESLDGFFVLDIRTKGEWDGGHIAEAHHLHGGIVATHLEELPRNKNIAVVCGSGFRASIVSSVLLREGFQNVYNVFGGMNAWKEEGFPVKREE